MGPRSLLLLLVSVAAAASTRYCVPTDAYNDCLAMETEAQAAGIDVKCVRGTDRIDCLEKIMGPVMIIQMSPKADVMFADPEDMWVAAKRSNETFRVFKEVRSNLEPEAPFRYESVAVVRSNLPVNKLSDLKGLKSCHTGMGRNAGYKIPYTTLVNEGVLKPHNDPKLSVRENELKTWSNFFSKSCIVGKWSNHPEINRQLKIRYAALCGLCEDASKCDYPDSMSGYEGALNCLVNGGGEVAFTKVIAVKRFFGLPVGKEEVKESKLDSSLYSYLCPDGTKRPISGPACPWAARPWQGYIAHKSLVSDADSSSKLSQELERLAVLSEDKPWKQTVLGLGKDMLPVDVKPSHPLQYLKKAGYLKVIEREVGGPMAVMRVCEVNWGFNDVSKCDRLAMVAASRDVRPRIECLQKTQAEECAKAVREGQADITLQDPHDAFVSTKVHKLKPILTEKYPLNGTEQYLVVIAPKESTFQKLADLENKRICFWKSKKSEFDMTVKVLVEQGLMDSKSCPYERAIVNFALGSSGSPTCLTKPTATVNGKPLFDDVIVRKLVPGLGRDIDAYHPEDKFELLCPGTPSRRPLQDVISCNFGVLPPNMVMSREDLTEVQRDELVSTMVKLGDMFNQNPQPFRLFGDFYDQPDDLASNYAVGFEEVKDVVPSFENFKTVAQNVIDCSL